MLAAGIRSFAYFFRPFISVLPINPSERPSWSAQCTLDPHPQADSRLIPSSPLSPSATVYVGVYYAGI